MKSKAMKIVEIAQSKKALNPIVLDVRKISNFCDFFVIFTGSSKTHICSIADEIDKEMRLLGVRAHHLEGYKDSQWVVLDYSSVIVHIFDEETRAFYDLEHLWADASKVGKKTQRSRKLK
ncbi:MAG: ribosome silencing factor [Candidatus Omnitrophica bacterium]|nr:ribosome silencing factor [Candidatus Omnitrophota bacterium]